jgi:hypothetical protein
MLLQPSFYLRWLIQLDQWAGIFLLLCAWWGAALHRSVYRWQVWGLWAGYGLLGLTFPYHILTHEYYNLALVPLSGLSIAPLAEVVFQKLRTQSRGWQWLASIILLIAIVYPAWIARSTLIGQDYVPEALGWQRLGETLPTDGKIIALSHDYGFRLMYYGWRSIGVWSEYDRMASADQETFEPYFLEKTAGYDYFLVTLPNALEQQPALRTYLFDHYPQLNEPDGYLLFDLTPDS